MYSWVKTVVSERLASIRLLRSIITAQCGRRVGQNFANYKPPCLVLLGANRLARVALAPLLVFLLS